MRPRPWDRAAAAVLVALGSLDEAAGAADASSGTHCPTEMADIEGRFCIDRWENQVDELGEGDQVIGLHSPFELVNEKRVRAASRPGVYPQAHISRDQAERACQLAGKRLCEDREWMEACEGRIKTRYPYGVKHREGYCNDSGASPLGLLHGRGFGGLDYKAMNDARLNRVPGSLARTGLFALCESSYGVHDMVGNLHEWTAEPRGTFRGGYYLDTNKLGIGCDYHADGHDRLYRDYSTGFRCCKSIAPAQ